MPVLHGDIRRRLRLPLPQRPCRRSGSATPLPLRRQRARPGAARREGRAFVRWAVICEHARTTDKQHRHATQMHNTDAQHRHTTQTHNTDAQHRHTTHTHNTTTQHKHACARVRARVRACACVLRCARLTPRARARKHARRTHHTNHARARARAHARTHTQAHTQTRVPHVWARGVIDGGEDVRGLRQRDKWS